MNSDFIFFLTIPTFQFVYASESVEEVLGFEQEEIHQAKLVELLADEEKDYVMNSLNAAVRGNKAASVLYLQLFHRREPDLVICQMTVSVAGNVIVGSIYRPSLAMIGSTARDRSAEEVIVAATKHYSVGYPAVNWTGTRFPRTALVIDRFEPNTPISHCTNNAILDNETCVQQPFFRYVAERDEDSVASFLSSLRRPSGTEANIPANVGFVYHSFTLCVTGRDSQASSAQSNRTDEVRVSAVGIASSDGLILVLKLEP
ncbi:tRNA (adenine-N(1)-)-methyltransferase catalytic subunit trm61 [Ceratobasidium sp. 423]|nr:tRNA (adenine-N(1)-)-methyltransferase catalytic subunit trm61 [Ceratobasidium sp. 423]